VTWQTSRLGDVLTLQRGHDLPDSQRHDGEVPVVSSSGITGHHSEAKAKAPGVVTGRYGTLGEVFYLEEDYWPLNTALYVTDFKGNDPKFIAYFLKNVLRDYRSDKAAVPGVNRNVLHELKVRSPDTATQKRISGFLAPYDSLIRNNQRRTAILEDAARQIFREWFVRLRFPGYEHARMVEGAPSGWDRLTLGDLVTLNYGKALKAEDRTEGPCPVYGSSGVVGTHERALATAPGIVVGRKGNVGSVFWCPNDYWPIDTVFFVDAETSSLWLYYALQHMYFSNTDGAVPGLNRGFAYSRPLIVPEPRLVRAFVDEASPIHEQITLLREVQERVVVARDLVLPRLMSGEIAV
jgi:type I restriction enzyme S subunit